MTLTDRIAVAAAGTGNALAWAQSVAVGNWTPAAAISAITGIGFAIVGLATYTIRQVGAARVETFKAWDLANRESFAGQIEELTESLAKARKSLHDFRNEASERELRHVEEVDRLHAEISLLHETNRQLRGEIERLTARIRELTAATDAVNAKLSGEMPASGD